MTTLAEETRWLDAIDQADLVRRREVTPVELVAAAAERMEAARPLNAVVLDLVDRAVERAKAPLPDVSAGGRGGDRCGRGAPGGRFPAGLEPAPGVRRALPPPDPPHPGDVD